MNEQQLADLLSEQLDRLLLGQEVNLPAEAAELNDLLSLGQQLNQVQFHTSAVAGAVFESQLATWSGVEGMPAGIWGIPKTLFTGLAGAGVGLVLLALGALTVLNMAKTAEPTQTLTSPAVNTPTRAAEPTNPTATNQPASTKPLPAPAKSSQGEMIKPVKPSSQGDQLPGITPTVQDTPTITPTATTAITTPTGVENGAGDSDETDSPTTPIGDEDRGHGNDPGGFDPDNPGNSSGVNGGLGRDDSSNGNSGNSGGNSGNNASQDNNKDNNKKDK